MFSTLSDEIVLGVFNYFSHEDLKVTAQVSRRFRRLAYDESLWPRIDLASKSLSSNSLAYIIKRGVKILRLKEAKVINYNHDNQECRTITINLFIGVCLILGAFSCLV